MGTVETVFATVVAVLAAVAVIGALVFAVVWEVCAIKRTLAAYRAARAARRTQLTDEDFWRQQRALNGPR
jgi:hypothetical protein